MNQHQTIFVQQLFVRNQTRIKAFILSLQPEFNEADDLLQEVFLVITRKAADFEQGTNFMAWARAIARLKILESKRRNRKLDLTLSEDVIDALCASAPPERPDEEQVAAIRSCLDKLAPRMQELVKRRYYVGQGPGEIARVLSWTTNAVNVALSKARKQLLQCIKHRSSLT